MLLIMNQAHQFTATLRNIFQMFADVGIFLAAFFFKKTKKHVVQEGACVGFSCKNSALALIRQGQITQGEGAK